MGRTEDLEDDIEVAEQRRLITQDGTVDYKGEPADKTKTGGWKITPYICCIEVTEKLATSGAQFNLVSFLVFEKKLPLPYAANMVTNFFGTSFLLPLLGGFLADTYFGRYYIIIGSVITQMLGYLVMVLTIVIPTLNNQDKACPDPQNCTAVHGSGLAVIYLGLYVIALGIGGIKATVSPFGADQFEEGDPAEGPLLPSFFNWFYWATMMGSLVASTLLIYMQDNVGWDWGWGILLIIMSTSLFQLIFKRRTYRYRVPKGSPLVTVFGVLVAAIRNYKLPPLSEQEVSKYYDEMRTRGEQRIPLHTKNLRWLDKAAKYNNSTTMESPNKWKQRGLNEVEDVKMLLRLLPVWLFTIFYWTTLAQATTFAVAQIQTTNRHLGTNFKVPPGSVTPVIFNFTVLLFLPLYDRLFIPFARKFTGNAEGITVLQRVGVGMAIPILSMIVAALVEVRRLGLVDDLDAEDTPKRVLPLTMWWFLPQYVILAIGEAFVYPGQLDFFYSEAPDSMQSLGTALMFCTISVGYFSSSVIVSIVNSATSRSKHGGWLQKNINTSRLDNYYWLLAILASINFFFYLLVAKLHTYKQVSTVNNMHVELRPDQIAQDPSTDYETSKLFPIKEPLKKQTTTGT